MKWLQWSTIDLAKGLGGVEVHARSLARELRKLGVDAGFSSDPKELSSSSWDVVHIHGSTATPLSISNRRGGAVRVHTLHGATSSRMLSCREWSWVGGYGAILKECRNILQADVVVSVRPNIPEFHLAQ